ncbi:hypothetical protein [Duganella sp. S19_KUP01_CR8]|uniref:hypothetical protein n=1 Tax=Duganella sp. S19_KUP01_CR8 TaxID=3025502 RepID=UPI002FCDB962
MGVEYRHFMVVDDADWRPQSDTAARVEAVLRDWSLIDGAEHTIDFSASQEKRGGSSNSAASPGPGVAVVYPGATGAAIEVVAGPSLFADMASDDRYLMRATLVIGDDFRVQWSSDSVYFELVSPPLANGAPIEGEDVDFNDSLFAASFPSEGASSPPVVVAHIEDRAKSSVAWDSCLGFWRGALLLTFGKDLPAFSEKVQALPAREFVAAISAALRGRLVEIGEFY